MKEKLVIIDGNSIMYRSFFALPPLMNVRGENTGAIYGFVNELVKVITSMEPRYIAVAFDVGKHTFRNEIFSEYKATRKPMPEDLASQMPLIKDLLAAMNVKVLEKAGLEADDIIGTISKRFDVETLILTGDRDIFQLVDKTTNVCFMRKGLSDVLILTPENLKAEYGVDAHQVADLKALQGDTADNIPGVPGVGPKTANTLIEKYGSIDGVYEHIDEQSGKLKENLVSGKDYAYMSKTLATINTKVDIECALDDLTYDFPFTAKTKALFERFAFRSILKKDELFASAEQNNSNQANSKTQKSEVQTNELQSLDEIKDLLSSQKISEIAFYEADSALHFCFDGAEYSVRKFVDLLSGGVALEDSLLAMKQIFEDDNVQKIFYDVKTWLYRLSESKINLSKNVFDVGIATNLCEGVVVKSLDDVFNYFEESLDFPSVSIFNCAKKLSKNLKNKALEKTFYDIELPLAFTLFNMERRGFKIDTKRLDELQTQYEKTLNNLEKQIYSLAGHSFNINSPKQLGEVLFIELQLPKSAKMSTSVDVLESLKGQHNIIPLILDYRKAAKFYGTYLAGMRAHIDSNNFVHTNFNQTLTATGRLSSSDPNLQNLPIRSEEGREIRSIFTASSEGRVLVDADYSQIELRVLAHFSGDENYISAFKSGTDIHSKTASEIFGVPAEMVVPRMRRVAKVVNFGVVYGISQYGLSQDIGVSPYEAKTYIEGFYRAHPKIDEYMKSEVEFARENGYTKTLFGRIRKIPEIKASNYLVRSRAERVAQNMCIQGSAAEIIKVAMINVEQRLKKENLDAQLIMQVHDELVVDCEKSIAAKVEKILKEEMVTAVELSVPMEVDAQTAYRWGDAH